MKLRIDMSCTEQEMELALREAKIILDAIGRVSCEIKIFHSMNRIAEEGHSWVTITRGCDIADKIEIYKLHKEIDRLKPAS